MSCRQLLLNFSKYVDQLIKDSYLADLHAFLCDVLLKTNKKVTEQIVFLLVRELSSSGDHFNDLIAFLGTVLNWELPLLHDLNRFTNKYCCLRIKDEPHMTVIKELSRFNVLELGDISNSGWIDVGHST